MTGDGKLLDRWDRLAADLTAAGHEAGWQAGVSGPDSIERATLRPTKKRSAVVEFVVEQTAKAGAR